MVRRTIGMLALAALAALAAGDGRTEAPAPDPLVPSGLLGPVHLCRTKTGEAYR